MIISTLLYRIKADKTRKLDLSTDSNKNDQGHRWGEGV